MTTRYWKRPSSTGPEWKMKDGRMLVHNGSMGWGDSIYSSPDMFCKFQQAHGVHECDAEGNPLPAEPDRNAPLTRADLEAFEARIMANLAELRKPQPSES